jgi:2-polyprenyl-3-methyl-5-hydroxy-6-metoxy-1,4-benzoquinol methylase
MPRGTKRGNFLGRDFEFWHCPACDLMFVDPFPGYGVYNEAYYEGRGPDPYVDYESEYRDYRATDRMVEFDDLWRVASGFIAENIPAGPVEWLDFGCGAGGLLKYLGDRGEFRSGGRIWPIRVTGHDVGTYAERLAKDDGLRILRLGELASEPDARYDVISLIEVIEHVEFPDPVFALAARLLKPGGLLLVTTGNIASLVARTRGLSYAYCLPEIHVSYFTPRALEIIYERHGLVPVRFRYDGTVRFKVIKTLRTAGRQQIARLALRLPLAVRLVDGLFGTSQMPCARKPR